MYWQVIKFGLVLSSSMLLVSLSGAISAVEKNIQLARYVQSGSGYTHTSSTGYGNTYQRPTYYKAPRYYDRPIHNLKYQRLYDRSKRHYRDNDTMRLTAIFGGHGGYHHRSMNRQHDYGDINYVQNILPHLSNKNAKWVKKGQATVTAGSYCQVKRSGYRTLGVVGNNGRCFVYYKGSRTGFKDYSIVK